MGCDAKTCGMGLCKGSCRCDELKKKVINFGNKKRKLAIAAALAMAVST